MVVDHFRFIGLPQQINSIFYILGRFAFPFFCFLLAYYFYKNSSPDSDLRYIKNLFIFTLISEISFRIYAGFSVNCINIMFTLLLSFLIIQSFTRYKKLNLTSTLILASIFILTLMLSLTDHFQVQYGLPGVFLPLAMYFFLKNKSLVNFLFLLFLAFFLNINFYDYIYYIDPYVFTVNILAIIVSISASLIPYHIVKLNLRFYVPAVKKWAYWFYPTHLLVLSFIAILFNG